MGNINVLDKHVANLIAAGEVVERPASVLKELCENAIDAGATAITVEIKNGGSSFMRVSDNGSGIEPSDMPLTIIRHATSKISVPTDLNGITTLGFRGEALAAIAAVSKLRIISRNYLFDTGTLLCAEDGKITEISEIGASVGTTVIVEELFGNVPARRKFLKRDAAETQAAASVIEKMMLSRPDIAFKFITDGTLRSSTSGDGKIANAIYAALGREFASKLIPLDYRTGSIEVRGYIGRPDNIKNSRAYQNFFLNDRFVKCKTFIAGLEQAFISYIPTEKYPCCVLYIRLHPAFFDVNVHPTKLEVKFSDDKLLFETVYYAVRSALEHRISRPRARLSGAEPTDDELPAEIQRETAVQTETQHDAAAQTETQRETAAQTETQRETAAQTEIQRETAAQTEIQHDAAAQTETQRETAAQTEIQHDAAASDTPKFLITEQMLREKRAAGKQLVASFAPIKERVRDHPNPLTVRPKNRMYITPYFFERLCAKYAGNPAIPRRDYLEYLISRFRSPRKSLLHEIFPPYKFENKLPLEFKIAHLSFEADRMHFASAPPIDPHAFSRPILRSAPKRDPNKPLHELMTPVVTNEEFFSDCMNQHGKETTVNVRGIGVPASALPKDFRIFCDCVFMIMLKYEELGLKSGVPRRHREHEKLPDDPIIAYRTGTPAGKNRAFRPWEVFNVMLAPDGSKILPPSAVTEKPKPPTEDMSDFADAVSTPSAAAAIKETLSRLGKPVSKASVRKYLDNAEMTALKRFEPEAPEPPKASGSADKPTAVSEVGDLRELSSGFKSGSIPDYNIVGELFLSYVIIDFPGSDTALIIDKHAAHERLIFEEMKKNMKAGAKADSQLLMLPKIAALPPLEYAVMLDFLPELQAIGFDFDLSGEHSGELDYEYVHNIKITAIPTSIPPDLAVLCFCEIIMNVTDNGGSVEITRNELYEKALYQAACKAAIKAGRSYDMENIRWLCDRLLSLDNIKFCPHGRPVAVELTKHELEHMFKRA